MDPERAVAIICPRHQVVAVQPTGDDDPAWRDVRMAEHQETGCPALLRYEIWSVFPTLHPATGQPAVCLYVTSDEYQGTRCGACRQLIATVPHGAPVAALSEAWARHVGCAP